MSKTSPSPRDVNRPALPDLERIISIACPYVVIAFVALLRYQGMRPYHAVPVFASLLLFGALRPAREYPLPLLGLSAVDMLLTTRHYGQALTLNGFVTWAAYLAAMFAGAATLRSSRSLPRVAVTSLSISIAFFVVSNFAVWAAWHMYPESLAGLVASYAAALPFFRNAVTSELIGALALFGVHRAAQPMFAGLRARRAFTV